MEPLRLDDLIEQLVAAREDVGGDALVQIGERGCELALTVRTEWIPDDDCHITRLVRIAGG